jgi:hypothetical protein
VTPLHAGVDKWPDMWGQGALRWTTHLCVGHVLADVWGTRVDHPLLVHNRAQKMQNFVCKFSKSKFKMLMMLMIMR